jgi:L,D-transpeptidase YcbB
LKESLRMRGLDRILSAALVVAIAVSPLAVWAATQGDGDDGAAIETRIPTPTPAEVKPPTSADMVTPAAPDLKLNAVPADAKPNAMPETGQGTASEAKPNTTSDTRPSAAPDAKPSTVPNTGAAADANPSPTPDSGPAAKDSASSPKSGDTAGAPGDSTTSSITDPWAAPMPPAPAPPASAQGAKPEPATAATPGARPASAGSETAPATKDAAKDNTKPLATNLAAADVPVAEKLRDLVAGRLDHILERKSDRQAVEAFYINRGFAPLWIEGGVANSRAQSAIARLKAAAADGLDPSDYPTADFGAAADHPDVLADDELKLTNAALTYARHAQIGRVHFSRVSPDIFYNLVAPDPREVLSRLAQAKDVGEALGAYNPPQDEFKQLRAKLAEVRGQGEAAAPARIAAGSLLRVGMKDDRVSLLRQRLHVPADNGESTYDNALSEAVRTFQRQHDLKPTGNLNASTVEALNGTPHGHVADILIANMERWRWLPRDLGKTYVMVNIPDYTLKVIHNGATVWRTRIVVGKPSTPTPLLSEPMKYITVNPTWNVPPSIVQNEYLPALQQDPEALARIGLQVDYNADGSLHIFQPPGEANALGRLRFNFPNKFLVYQHDTPDKNLFARERRAYSHGCMRVQDPLDYAQVLLSYAAPNEGYTAERLRRMFGSDEYDINFSSLIPVHITYQTAFIEESGKLELRDDVYGRDARTLAVLRGEDRRIADVPVVERRETTRHQAVRMPRTYPFQSPFRDTGLSFFERLFR